MSALTSIATGLTSVGGGVIGMIGQRKREDRAMMNQRQLMSIQHKNQQELNEQGHKLQKEMWDYTSFPNQIKMLEKSGLNPALIYGMGGGSASTVGSQTGGQAAGGQAPQPQHMDISSIIQANTMAADIQLKKALADKATAEADKTRGIDTKVAEVTAASITEGINNLKAQQALMQAHTIGQNLSNMLEGESMDDQIKTMKWTAHKIEAESRKAKSEADVSEKTIDERISKIQAEAVVEWMKYNLMKSEVKLNEAEAKKAAADIVQKWTSLGLEREGLQLKERELKVKEFEAEIKANYPSVWEALGHGTMNVAQALQQLVYLGYFGSKPNHFEKLK